LEPRFEQHGASRKITGNAGRRIADDFDELAVPHWQPLMAAHTPPLDAFAPFAVVEADHGARGTDLRIV
jgi:hypothetical protein